MKKFLCGLLLALLVVSSVSVAFAGRQDFTLKNETGKTIISFWVSPAKDNKWDAEVDKVTPWKDLLTGESCNVTFNPNKNKNEEDWDIRADFEDGTSIEWNDFDLFKTYTITLRSDGTAHGE